jgi:hypothetical protein
MPFDNAQDYGIGEVGHEQVAKILMHAQDYGAIPTGAPPPVTTTYLQHAWDDVLGHDNPWETVGAPDPGGASYPGPGVWGVTVDPLTYRLDGWY